MTLEKKLEKLEGVVMAHLIESGTIKDSLTWLKRAVLGLYGLIGLAIIAVITAGAERLWK